ncbi:MAG: hypothetical protein JSV51_02630 [Candidatus Bathyarchaeota archaeon]|nr:MAG: hypothetical protein JSV51_02630 [Candidatus Bathyarchaeota archaeon]
MPIDKREFKNGKLHSKVEEEVISFLDERKERAFTSQEIMEGVRYHTEFSTPEITKMSTFAIADFTSLLQHFVEQKKIDMKVVRGRMYFMLAGETLAKCPKCEQETQPAKTWKMAGRPNRKGEKLQLHIGLFRCPSHGFFRIVLGKKRIPASATKKRVPATKKRKPATKIRTRKKSSTGKKRKALPKKRSRKRTIKKKKKSGVWTLV